MKNDSCIICGEEFTPRKGKMYCSNACKQQGHLRKKIIEKETNLKEPVNPDEKIKKEYSGLMEEKNFELPENDLNNKSQKERKLTTEQMNAVGFNLYAEYLEFCKENEKLKTNSRHYRKIPTLRMEEYAFLVQNLTGNYELKDLLDYLQHVYRVNYYTFDKLFNQRLYQNFVKKFKNGEVLIQLGQIV